MSPGTIVHVTSLDSGAPETYTILGAWDGDPENNVLSYLTPLAQTFINKGPGTEVEFASDNPNKQRFRIDSIEAWKKA